MCESELEVVALMYSDFLSVRAMVHFYQVWWEASSFVAVAMIHLQLVIVDWQRDDSLDTHAWVDDRAWPMAYR